jgi:hypothetical protein
VQRQSSIGANGRIKQVRGGICTDVEGHEKSLILTIDLLWKHVGRRRATVNMGKVRCGEYYYLGNNQRV